MINTNHISDVLLIDVCLSPVEKESSKAAVKRGGASPDM